MSDNQEKPCTKCGGDGVECEVHHGPDEFGQAYVEQVGCSECSGRGTEDPHMFCAGGGGRNFHCGCKYNQ